MGLWDGISDFLSGGARSDVDEGYDKAQQYMEPYRKGGKEDYDYYRNWARNYGEQLDPYKGGENWMYSHMGGSPNDFYNEIMSGYSESPEAKYEQKKAFDASTRGASASGMMGSGSYLKGLQENAAGISDRDRQRYYQNVMGANAAQMGYLQNYQGQQDKFNAMQQYLANLGYGGAGTMGQNEVNRGLALGKFDQSAFDQVAGLIGAGGQNYKQNFQYNTAGGEGGGAVSAAQQIPWYLMLA